MKFNTDAPRVPVQIQGIEFTVPIVFEPGHVLSENDAHVLNQTLRENLRNNFASEVKDALEKAKTEGKQPDVEMLQINLDDYLEKYEFGINRGGGRASLDPVEREARDQALKAVKAALKKKGVPIKDVSKEKLDEYIDQALEKYPGIREKARVVVEARKGAVGDVSVALD